MTCVAQIFPTNIVSDERLQFPRALRRQAQVEDHSAPSSDERKKCSQSLVQELKAPEARSDSPAEASRPRFALPQSPGINATSRLRPRIRLPRLKALAPPE